MRRGPGGLHSRRRVRRRRGAIVRRCRRVGGRNADCLVRVGAVTGAQAEGFPEGKALIGLLAPLRNPELVSVLARRRLTSFSLDAIPRISRAQSMDTLSSMATIAGYKAVLLAAGALPKFLPMLTTAAGTIRPSQALILGAGVAGLQAIATSRRMGAVVEAFDVRAAVKEQIKSLGATFLEVPNQENLEDKGGYAKEVSAETLAKQRQLLHERAKVADFIITTAQVPGKPAPRLITKEMVADMKPGSVIVDLAAESGGNCELTKAGKTIARARRHHHRPGQPARDAAAGCQPHVRAEPGQFHSGNHQRKRFHDGLEE